jgi:PKD repeat protein
MKKNSLLTFAIMLMGLWLTAQTPCSNLVTNGSFEATTPGFTSALTVNTGCVINTYNVTTNFNLKCPNYPSRTDHTTGIGKFLIVQNSTAVNVWQNTVTVTPNTPYTFSFWVANGVTNAMTYAMMVNGLNVNQISVTQATPTWEKYTFSGFCPAGVTSLSIAIKQITFGEAYVYGIDDVSFISCSDSPCIGCTGSVASANLISNGSFTNGDIGFTTGLTYDNSIGGGAGCGAGRYGVYTNFTSFCTNWPSLLDHTNNSPASSRKYMTIDGYDFLGFLPLWQSPVNLTANTDYCFSFWWASVYPTSSQSFTVSIDIVNANGTVVTTSLGTETISQSPQGSWVQKTINWNSGNLTGLQYVAIRQTTLGGFRDWGIADICFTAKPPVPCNADFTFGNLHTCGNVLFTNTSTPTTNLAYSWNFGDAASGTTNTSTQQSPTHLFTTCGTYNVCLIIVSPECRDTVCHTVIVVDNVPPVARCKPGVGVILDANCQYTVTTAFVDNGSTDDCKIKSLTVNPSILTGCQNTNVTLTVTDWCNNFSTCTMGIQTIETVPPIITCPPTATVTCTKDTIPSVTGTATATDNCPGVITFTHSDIVSGNFPCDATIRRTWIATDACGNSSSCIQTIIVRDNVPPIITNCPTSQTVNTNAGVCYYTFPTPLVITATDCDPNPVITCTWTDPNGVVLPLTAQTQFPKGVNSIKCTARDKCGNVSKDCFFTLTVVDNEKPKIICPLSISVVGTITPPSTVCKAIVSNIAPIATDNCPMSSVNFTITGATTVPNGITDASGTVFMLGVSTVTYIVTDMAGNIDSCKFTVTVRCEGCECGNFVSLFYRPSQGAQSQPKVCGDTLIVPCNPQFSPILTGAFNCTGVCSPTGISYEIRKPAGGSIVQQGVLTYPNFTLPLLATYFTSAGFYELTLIGQCGTAVSCLPCKFTLKVDSCCCQNRDQFIQAVKNAVTVTANNALCKSTVTIGNLPTCDVISNLQWGDGATSAGPFVAGDMPMHTYSSSGTYFISYLAVEKNTNGQICFEYSGRDSVKLMCNMSDTCRCGSFSNMTFRPAQGAQTMSVKCGDTLTISCNTAFNPTFGGTFLCTGTNCRDSAIRWEFRVQPSNNLVASGNLTGPNFSIAIPSINFATAGMYELTFTGQCGTQSCPPCKFKINILPPINLSTGLTGYFPFNGNANDVSPTLINGIPTNVTPTLASNGTTSAYNFNGTSSVIIGTPDSRGVTDKVSVVAWVKTSELARGMWIAGQYNGGQARGYLLSIGDVNDMNIGQASFSGRVDLSNYYSAISPPSVKVNNGQWHCIVGTAGLGISGTTEWRIYVDAILRGNQIGLTTPSVAPSAGSTHFTMGRHSDSNLPLMYYKGDMDDVRVYNKVLTQCEIDSLCSTRLVSGVGDKRDRMHLSIFPNPNSGVFTVELPTPATSNMKLRVTDLTGRLLLEKQTEEGNSVQTVKAGTLPDGLYFIQVVSEGKVVAMEKFVKQ